MSILNNPLAEITIQDIVNANSARATYNAFNTIFNMENMSNFYAINSISSLACHHSEEHKDSNIEDDTSQPLDDLALGCK